MIKASPSQATGGWEPICVCTVASRVVQRHRRKFRRSVQRMRERVTDHIPQEERDVQLKWVRGGLRDIEFTIQLLQLVHGQTDENVRQSGTLPALDALAGAGTSAGRRRRVSHGTTGSFDCSSTGFSSATVTSAAHLMPRSRMMRSSPRESERAGHRRRKSWGSAGRWSRPRFAPSTSNCFTVPLLSAAAIAAGGRLCAHERTGRREAHGQRDSVNPGGALRHIGALTAGLSRRASYSAKFASGFVAVVCRGCRPGSWPSVFRRLSDALGESHWFLRMLRDSSGAGHRLTQLLSGSRFIGDLFERIPEAVAWLENDTDLVPRSLAALEEEGRAITKRHASDPQVAALAVRTARRREILRIAIASVLDLLTVEQAGLALSDVMSSTIRTALSIARSTVGKDLPAGFEFAIIGMGRFGGRELGFGSDADVMYVYRAPEGKGEESHKAAERIVVELGRLTEDIQFPLDLDIGLRPEGKNGAVVRSLDSYRAYYERWSLTWEAQALLRARAVAGDDTLAQDFELLADTVRYPSAISAADIREVRRIKARVEAERLPQAADPLRHLKLGRGSLSDVEWLIQLLQLEHAATLQDLRTTSTLHALEVAQEAELLSASDVRRLRDAWIFASRTRSAMTLWTSKTSDVLPRDRDQLDGVARLMGYPPRSASQLEDDYLRVTRRARHVFETRFYGDVVSPAHSRG